MDKAQEAAYERGKRIAYKHFEREVRKAGGIIPYIREQSLFGAARYRR